MFSEHTRRRPSRGFHLLDRARLDDPDSDEDRKWPLNFILDLRINIEVLSLLQRSQELTFDRDNVDGRKRQLIKSV